MTDHDDAFLEKATCYFEALNAWYETADIDVEGGALVEAVAAALGRKGLRSSLNPGHLVGYDEWVHSPVRQKSAERIASGMPFQVDIIPVPMENGEVLNCEDPVTFADATLRNEIRVKHPTVWNRIERRRAFLRDTLGIVLKDAILPVSSTPLCLPPFWLTPGRLFTRS